MAIIPIFSNTHTSQELTKAIKECSNTNIELTVIDNPEKYRSVLSDPVVVAAIFGAGGGIVVALIAAFVTIYTHRRDKEESKGDASIVINLHINPNEKSSKSKIVIPLDTLNLEERQEEIEELDLHPERIENINYTEQP